MSPSLDPEQHLSHLTRMYTNAGAKFTNGPNTARYMPLYPTQPPGYSIVTPTPAPPASEDSLYESMGSPSRWPDASPEPPSPSPSPVNSPAPEEICWYQSLPGAITETTVTAAADPAAAAVAACSASAAAFSEAAAACTAAAAAILAAGAPAARACRAAAASILAAGIPAANVCAAASDACTAAAAQLLAAGPHAAPAGDGDLAGGVTTAQARSSATGVIDKVAANPLSSPVSSPSSCMGEGLDAGAKTAPAAPRRSTRSTHAGIKKVQAPRARAGSRPPRSARATADRPLRPARATAEKLQTSHAKPGARSLRSTTNDILKKVQTPNTQTRARSLASANADINDMPKKAQVPNTQTRARSLRSANADINSADKTLGVNSAGKKIAPKPSKRAAGSASGVYNLRSVKESYNLRSANRIGTPKPAAGKHNIRSAVNKNNRKPVRKGGRLV